MVINGTVHTILHPVECPPMEAVIAAQRVLNDHALAVYQILYANGLALPGDGGQFVISRDSPLKGGSVGNFVRVSLARDNSGYSFLVRTPEEAFEKAGWVLAAVEAKKQKVGFRACCPLAEHTPCVCVESFKCPLHGGQCHGSHD